MALYEEKCAKRLCELIEAKIKEVQSNRDKLNAEIEEKNKANHKRAKAIGNPTSKVVLRKKFSPFTKKELLEDINKKENCIISEQMFRLYQQGKSYPPVDVMKSLSNYFDVSFGYLAGAEDTRDSQAATIQELLHLDTSAIYTLLSMNDFPDLLKVMNAILSNKYDLRAYLSRISMQIYQDKLQERRLDVLKNILGSSESANEMMINRFSMLLSFYEYIERNYLPYVKESFDSSINDSIQEELRKYNNYDEYEKEMIQDLQFAQDLQPTQDSVTVTVHGSGTITPMDRPEEKP